jgi:hypothetical protein
MAIDDPDLKSQFEKQPPYALKFWNHWNGTFPDANTEECQKSLGYHAILLSKRRFEYKHPFK